MFHYTPAPPKAYPPKINGLARHVANLFSPTVQVGLEVASRNLGTSTFFNATDATSVCHRSRREARTRTDFCFGDTQPYAVSDQTEYTIPVQVGLRHTSLEIEIRQTPSRVFLLRKRGPVDQQNGCGGLRRLGIVRLTRE
jgi:hypothetical protein